METMRMLKLSTPARVKGIERSPPLHTQAAANAAVMRSAPPTLGQYVLAAMLDESVPIVRPAAIVEIGLPNPS